jgi:acetyl-CoA carboxylase biotin carboxyl carrier protein
MSELRELIALIQENDFAEFELQRAGFRLHVRRDFNPAATAARNANAAAPQPIDSDIPPPNRTTSSSAKAPASPEHPGSRAETAASENQDLHMIASPIVGTFYRAASPNAEPFVKIGSNVEPESIVCIIEAMKLMNEIQAETSGEVVKIYVENGQPVEYGQPLFGIRK